MYLKNTVKTIVIICSLSFGSQLWANPLSPNGIPVRCSGYAKPGTYTIMSCKPIAERHGWFRSVPWGYFLQVTEIFVAPDAGTDRYGLVDVAVQDIGQGALWERVRLRNHTYSNFSQSYTTPHLLVDQGHQLRASGAGFTKKWSNIDITGFLIPVEDVPTLN